MSQSKLIKLHVTELDIDETESFTMHEEEPYIELLCFTDRNERLFIRGSDFIRLKTITNELQQTKIAQLTAQVAQLRSASPF